MPRWAEGGVWGVIHLEVEDRSVNLSHELMTIWRAVRASPVTNLQVDILEVAGRCALQPLHFVGAAFPYL